MKLSIIVICLLVGLVSCNSSQQYSGQAMKSAYMKGYERGLQMSLIHSTNGENAADRFMDSVIRVDFNYYHLKLIP